MKKCCLIDIRMKTEIKISLYKILKKITKKKMIIDVTGTLLTPGNFGEDCKGNGKHFNYRGRLIECCCEECDYMMCCLNRRIPDKCLKCTETDCPYSK